MENQVKGAKLEYLQKPKRARVTEGEGDFPHHESRVGERYNAVVPDFDESVAREVQNGSEESIASEKVFVPRDIEEETILDYLNSAKTLTGRDSDFLLQMLYEHDFDTAATMRSLKKNCQNYYDSIFQRGKLPYTCSCFCHTYPVYRQNHYRSFFKRNWGLKQLEKLNINMEEVESMMNEDLPPIEEICAICGDGGDLILCDGGCNRAYHIECLRLKEVPETEKWVCPNCLRRKTRGTSSPRVKVEDTEDYQEVYTEKEYSHLPSPTGNVKKRKTSKRKKDAGKDEAKQVSKEDNPRAIRCPMEGCSNISENRTSLLSHARAYHPNDYAFIAKKIGCNFSYQLDHDLIESHTFTYKCPIPGCGNCYDRFTSFERHLIRLHGASGISDFEPSEYIDREIVKVGRREDLFRAYRRKLERDKEKGKKSLKRAKKADDNDEDY